MSTFDLRLETRKEELKTLFTSLYGSDEKLGSLILSMREYYDRRSDELKSLDKEREDNPLWYRQGDMLGLTMYSDLFASSLKGLKGKVGYLNVAQAFTACAYEWLRQNR